jgi:hypothetical protein
MTLLQVAGHGAWLRDVRTGGPAGEDRALRVSWHPEQGCVVLSTWRDGRCSATVRLAPDEVAALVGELAGALAAGAAGAADVPVQADAG